MKSTLTLLCAAVLSPVATNLAASLTFPLGTATPSDLCGLCHQEIYQEYSTGFGSDGQYGLMVYQSLTDKVLTLPSAVSSQSTAHAFAGVDPFALQARNVENKGQSCNVCHFPQPFVLPDKDLVAVPKPTARPADQEAVGITCASCHLNPDGTIRGPFGAPAPHVSLQDPAMQTSAACAYCHAAGGRVIGKQTQTFLEWREDFNKAGLGPQQCQDCHMPHTNRKLAEAFDGPVRPVARHLWPGAHSIEQLRRALHLEIVPVSGSQSSFEFHIMNHGAGHSVPTGSNRRAVYLTAEVVDLNGAVMAKNEWMFAPWYANRPDDKSFLDADKQLPDALAATQADAQGPHETPIRAGEERVLTWIPAINAKSYTVRAVLTHDLNRYNDRAFAEDQKEMTRASISVGAVPLSIMRTGTNLVVSWPKVSSGLLLEKVNSLSGTSSWMAVLGVATNSSTLNPAGSGFYRLRKL